FRARLGGEDRQGVCRAARASKQSLLPRLFTRWQITAFRKRSQRRTVGSLRMWSEAGGKELKKGSLQRPGAMVQPTPLCFSPGGTMLAVVAWRWLDRKDAKGMTRRQSHRVALLEVNTGEV